MLDLTETLGSGALSNALSHPESSKFGAIGFALADKRLSLRFRFCDLEQ